MALSERKLTWSHRTRRRAHTVQPQPIRVRSITETRRRVRANTPQRDLISAPRIIQTTLRRSHRVTTIRVTHTRLAGTFHSLTSGTPTATRAHLPVTLTTQHVNVRNLTAPQQIAVMPQQFQRFLTRTGHIVNKLRRHTLLTRLQIL